MQESQPGTNQDIYIQHDRNTTISRHLDGHSIRIVQHWLPEKQPAELKLQFFLAQPVRFSVHVWIPENCHNACASLNNQFLLGWFAELPRCDIPALSANTCASLNQAVSTIRPGRYQTVNFRWQNHDELVFYLIMANKSDSDAFQ